MSILLDLLLLRLVLHLNLSFVFLFSLPYISYFASFTEINFPNKGGDKFLFGLVFLGLDYSCPLSPHYVLLVIQPLLQLALLIRATVG